MLDALRAERVRHSYCDVIKRAAAHLHEVGPPIARFGAKNRGVRIGAKRQERDLRGLDAVVVAQGGRKRFDWQVGRLKHWLLGLLGARRRRFGIGWRNTQQFLLNFGNVGRTHA